MPTDSRGNEIEFVNKTTINGRTWAQIATRYQSHWWDINGDEKFYATDGPGHIDLENWTPAYIQELEFKITAAKVLNKKVARQDLKKAVKSLRNVHNKADRVEAQRYGSRGWFG